MSHYSHEETSRSETTLAADGRFIEAGRWYQGRYYERSDETTIAQDGRFD